MYRVIKQYWGLQLKGDPTIIKTCKLFETCMEIHIEPYNLLHVVSCDLIIICNVVKVWWLHGKFIPSIMGVMLSLSPCLCKNLTLQRKMGSILLLIKINNCVSLCFTCHMIQSQRMGKVLDILGVDCQPSNSNWLASSGECPTRSLTQSEVW